MHMITVCLIGLEKQPKLPAELVPPLHKYTLTPNLSPVKVNALHLFEIFKDNHHSTVCSTALYK